MSVDRLRLLLVGALGVVVALQAGQIFDQRSWELVLVPLIVVGVCAVTTSLHWVVRVITIVVAVVAAVACVAVVAGGDLADAMSAFSAGPRRILSTDWPSPVRADLLAAVALGLGLLLAAAAELSRRPDLHLLPLLPIGLAVGAVVALSAPAGAAPMWLLPIGVLVLAFVAFGHGAQVSERWSALGGESTLLPTTVFAVALTAGLAVPLTMTERADPRDNDDAEIALSLLDPIEAVLALQEIDPPVGLHDVSVAGIAADSTVPERWRAAALVDYDGLRWTPSLTLRPIGRRLDPGGAADVAGSISFRDDDLQLVPLPGAAVTVDASIETDPDRTLVRLADRPTPGESVDFSSRLMPDNAEADPGQLVAREIDETASVFTPLAESIIAEAATDGEVAPDLLGRLALIEQTMRDDYLLDPDAPGGGLQSALIVRFVRDTQRGNAEQFATAFALLARSLGADARVATGFEVPPESVERTPDGARLDLSSADAAIWPEVAVGDDWVPFSPVPDEEVSDEVPDAPAPQVQTPAAPQPPIAPPPEVDDQPPTDDEADAVDDSGSLPTVVAVALRVATGIALLLLPLLLAAAIILGLKWRRRRRRLSGPPEHRIRGAWSEATNRLVDAGFTISIASSNNEIAADGTNFASSCGGALRRLASLATAATFGVPAHPDHLADDAAACLAHLDSSMSESRTRWQRMRWRLSVRSLRRRTRSPV